MKCGGDWSLITCALKFQDKLKLLLESLILGEQNKVQFKANMLKTTLNLESSFSLDKMQNVIFTDQIETYKTFSLCNI